MVGGSEQLVSREGPLQPGALRPSSEKTARELHSYTPQGLCPALPGLSPNDLVRSLNLKTEQDDFYVSTPEAPTYPRQWCSPKQRGQEAFPPAPGPAPAWWA